MADIVVNGRFLGQRMTGVQRVAHEITRRLAVPHRVVRPAKGASGARGHGWEQMVLPARAAGGLIWSPCNMGPLAARRQVVTIHDAAVFEHPEWFSSRFGRVYRGLLPLLARRVARVVTVSHFSRDRLAEALGIDAARIAVVHNGVGDQFRPTPALHPALVPIVGDRPYFATLSTREPRKNLQLVMRAWALARPRLPEDMVLLVVGGQGASAVFGDRPGAQPDGAGGGIIHTGYLPDDALPSLLSGAHGLLYPSLYEGFGLPALEAMACGTPAVTTRLTSLPEVCGEDALYVDPADPQDLADALVRLAGDPDLRADLGRRGLARSRQFNWDKAAKQMDEILTECV